MCDICSKLTIKTPERRRRHWRRSDVFIVNTQHILDLVPVFLLLTLNMYFPAGLYFLIFLVPFLLNIELIPNYFLVY